MSIPPPIRMPLESGLNFFHFSPSTCIFGLSRKLLSQEFRSTRTHSVHTLVFILTLLVYGIVFAFFRLVLGVLILPDYFSSRFHLGLAFLKVSILIFNFLDGICRCVFKMGSHIDVSIGSEISSFMSLNAFCLLFYVLQSYL